jgi:hypothetical protein
VAVRAALRVAILRRDYDAQIWLTRELEGFGAERDRSEDRYLRAKLTALVGEAEARAMHKHSLELAIARRRISGKDDQVVGHGVVELETLHRSAVALYNEPIPAGLTPLDTGVAVQRQQREKASVFQGMIEQESILGRIQDAAYRYLLKVESELLDGIPTPDVISRGQEFVKSRLAVIAPDALASLESAQARVLAGDSEALSQAATSCRRTIKALADALYAPGEAVIGDDGVERSMDDEHYRNRLIEFVRTRRGKSTHAAVLATNLTDLGSRLKALDDLASKGVHSELSGDQAESCLAWTYMLAADLLRIEAETPDETAEASKLP